MKRILRVLLYFIGTLLMLLIVLWFWPSNPVQQDAKLSSQAFSKSLSAEDSQLRNWQAQLGEGHDVLQPFEKAMAYALMAYPQLKDAKIEFRASSTSAPLESNFKWLSLFGAKENRVYRVYINTSKNSAFDPVLLENLPFNAQVGILAHELGHIAYYEQRSTWEILAFGIKYFLDSDFRAQHEQSTDLMPVYQGLGWQIYEYAYYVRKSPACKPLYEEFGKEFVDKYYLSDERLLDSLMGHELYASYYSN